jgi:UDP-glucose 4-epimerase
MTTCIVTGGNGFIGRHVVSELLGRGLDVVIYDSVCGGLTEARTVRDDIRNYQRLAQCLSDADYVFHLSGVLGTSELFDEPRKAIEINILGALNVLEASLKRKAIRIFFPTKQNAWNNIYSLTAQAVEKLGHSYHDNFGIDVRILRLPNIYGPRQKISPVRKAIPLFITQALTNRPIEIFGDGNQPVELAYVEDAAKLIVDYMMIGIQPPGTCELISDVRLTVNELADLIIDITASDSEKIYCSPRRGETGNTEIARARDVRELLVSSQQTPLVAAMVETINWYKGLIERDARYARDRFSEGAVQ